MKIIKAYKGGLKTTLRNLRLITVGYLFLLIPALLIALPYRAAFKGAMGTFIAPGKLLQGFDFTAYMEMLNFEGDKISASTSQAIFLVFFYIFVSLFISAGIIFSLNNNGSKGNLLSVVTGGSRFYWRFLKLNFYSMVVHLIIAAMIYVPFAILIKSSINQGATEKDMFFTFLPFGIFHLIVMLYLFTINNYAKFALVHNNSRKVLRSLWSAVKFVTWRFFGVYTLTLLLLIVPALLFYSFMKIGGSMDMTSGLMILMVFIVQQIYVWLRVACKVWFLGGQFEYYLMNNSKN
jgi:hypothetical protein